MKKIAIFGGSGLVGKKVIKLLVSNGNEVISFQRNKRASESGEKQEIIDFGKIDEYQFDGDVVVVCLGTTKKKAGSKEAFVMVDYELVNNIGVWAKQQGVKQFHVISSVGTSQNAKGLYLKTKWRMEQSVSALGFEKLCIYRPSVYADLDRRPIRLFELAAIPLAYALAALFRKFKNYKPIHTRILASKIIFAIDADLSASTIFENTDILNSNG